MNPYQKLQQRKRTWTPIQPTAGKLREGSEETIRRALALRALELPVGEFISEAVMGEVPEAARDLLISNIRDEEKHDVALGYAARAHGVDAIIQTTPYSKQWWLRELYSSFSSRSFASVETPD
jgi:hypothetical protein